MYGILYKELMRINIYFGKYIFWVKYTHIDIVDLYFAYIYFRLNKYRFYLLLIILGGPEKGPLVLAFKKAHCLT